MARPLKERGEKALSRLIYDISKKALPEEGKLLAQLLQAWKHIVGDSTLQKTTWPHKITMNKKTGKAKLDICVSSASDRFVIHYQEEMLRTKLQDYFGGTLLEKISFHYEALPASNEQKLHVNTPPEEAPKTTDERLQKALERLGKALK